MINLKIGAHISVRNEINWIGRVLRYHLDCQNFHAIIVNDDASYDGTREVIEAYSQNDNRVIPIYTQPKKGFTQSEFSLNAINHTQSLIRKVKMEVNMKNFLSILVILALLVSLPATAAWSQSDHAKQCMETCLEPAIKSGDEDVIKDAVKQCKAQCNPEPQGYLKLDSAGSGMSTRSIGECSEICPARFEQCLIINGQSPEHCSQVLEGCWEDCLE